MSNYEKIIEYIQNPINAFMVITALDDYTSKVKASKERVREKMKDSIIHPEAWIDAAESWE